VECVDTCHDEEIFSGKVLKIVDTTKVTFFCKKFVNHHSTAI